MFIVSPTRGGYRGDVNTAFRTGRRDAFDDYIDSHNKALQADNNTYNFNQRVVRDTANNYILQNNMAQDARAEALDFAKKGTEIANAQYDFDVNSNRLDYIYNNGGPKVTGEARANIELNKTFTEVEQEKNKLSNAREFDKLERDSNSKVTTTTNENKIYTNELQSKFNYFNNKNSFTNARVASKVKELQKKGDTRSPQEIEAELRGDSAFMEGVESERQAGLAEARQEIENFNSTNVTGNNKKEKLRTPRFSPKAVDFNTDDMKSVVDFVNEQLRPFDKDIKSFKEGDAFMGPKGEIYQIRGGQYYVLNFNSEEDRALFIQSMPRANPQQTSTPTSTPNLGN